MAFIVRRSRALAFQYSQMQIISTNVLFGSSNLSFQCFKPACIFSLNVRNLGTAKKDELYRQITIEVKGHDQAVLNSYQKFTAMAAGELGVNVVKIYEPPRVIARMSLLKSVFVHKRHFHQYEMRTLYRVFEIKNITGSTASTFLEYIQRNLPEGVAMKVTKHQLEKFPDHIKPPSTAAKSSEAAHTIEDDSSKSTEEARIDQNTSETTEVAGSNNNTAEETTTAAEGIVYSKALKPKHHSKKSTDVNSDDSKKSTDVNSGSSETPTSSSGTSVSKSKTKKGKKSDKPAEVDS